MNVRDGDCDCPETRTALCVLEECPRKRYAWRWVKFKSGPSVVYPLADLRDHEVGSERCWCNPTYDDGILVHRALDGRETYEQGRKVQ
jgi:hypothetical protein